MNLQTSEISTFAPADFDWSNFRKFFYVVLLYVVLTFIDRNQFLANRWILWRLISGNKLLDNNMIKNVSWLNSCLSCLGYVTHENDLLLCLFQEKIKNMSWWNSYVLILLRIMHEFNQVIFSILSRDKHYNKFIS